MEKTKVLFYSKMQHPKLVMETKKTFKHDGEAAQGKVIHFDHHHFETDDPEKIEFIRNHPLFGHEYIEVDSKRNEPAPVGQPTAAKMDSPEDQKLAQFRSDLLGEVNTMLQDVVSKVETIVSDVATPAKETKKTTSKKKDSKKEDTTDADKSNDDSVASENK